MLTPLYRELREDSNATEFSPHTQHSFEPAPPAIKSTPDCTDDPKTRKGRRVASKAAGGETYGEVILDCQLIGPVLPVMSLKCHQARAKVRASHVRLTYVWSTLELTKSLLIVGKTLFLGNGARCDFGSNLRCSFAGRFVGNRPCCPITPNRRVSYRSGM